ncbi:MAG: Gfo/Idh/MocA family oxidoreductase [Proteobacteria bacterium]|nr:Gfo/Idh/MocA family oxidoreductase [Pseudomonadota bacterium]
MQKIRTAVVGVGHFGRFHAEKYAGLAAAELVAVVDIDRPRAEAVAKDLGVRPVFDYREILGQVDAVSIVVPTALHYRVAKAFLEHGQHVLVEKPITDDLAQADELIGLARANGLTLQVGHVERFSAVRLGIEGIVEDPVFIECNRLAPFPARGADIDVILDLMIHDIDIILDLVGAPVVEVHAVGVPVLTGEVDIANARVRFANGCIANITASRVSMKDERKMRIFQRHAYLSIDFLNNSVVIAGIPDAETFTGPGSVKVEERHFEEGDKLAREIEAFVVAVTDGSPPLVSGEDSRRALEAALMITRTLETSPRPAGEPASRLA